MSRTAEALQLPQCRPAHFPSRVEASRPEARGKFLFAGGEKLHIRGVTYGPCQPKENGSDYHDREAVERDLAEIAANGLNAIRIPHTTPPRWLLDVARKHGLGVVVGLSAEQYVGYLTDRRGAPDVEEAVRAKVRACAGHPAILFYALGNEIPAGLVRWNGRGRIERYLQRLYRAAKAEDPRGLFTYVNYPTTEYLQLPFLDLLCFNVYLESGERLEAYLARLQSLAGDRPLVLAEIGLDSLRNGELAQARSLSWQIRTAFAAGCAGAFVFAWTDEWYRDGVLVEDWAFGITDRRRRPKAALAAVCDAFAESPFPRDLEWPRISVVVCTHNGARVIRDCLEGLTRLEYPDFEVIVVDDGSTDGTASIAWPYGFRLIRTPNRGLSSARNSGLAAATGEIVAYIDDDAYPDPHWLSHLATTFLSSSHAAVGGPNLPPPGDGTIAEAVANAPGGPVQVLLTDREAEHIPGCNMAFRKAALEAIGGFDPQFRVAGDDVDVCWRIREKGWTLGFNPAATVWHHRRNSMRAYWRQQKGYGRAEALLEKKWPEKYNGAGHLTWAGRVYGKGLMQTLGFLPSRVYHGTWGSAPYQSLYEPATGLLASLPAMPEWYLIIAVLALLSSVGALWKPLLAFAPLLGVAACASGLQALLGGWRAQFSSPPRSPLERLTLRTLTSFLHLLQPMARLRGRLEGGLRRWRRLRGVGVALPLPRAFRDWTRDWQDPAARLLAIESALRTLGAYVHRGGDFDRWDLEVRGGMLGTARLLMVAEDQPEGCQLVRYRWWPRVTSFGLTQNLLFGLLSAGAAWDRAWVACAMLGLTTFLLALRTGQECGSGLAALGRAIQRVGEAEAC